MVPGDIVLLETGNIVPADLRIIKVGNFLIDESILTGESFPVSKIPQQILEETKEIFEAKNIVFAGTSVISGAAEGIVIGTGRETVLGEITKLVSGISRESVYEKDLFRFSRLILKIIVITIAFIFLANLIIKGTENFSIFLIRTRHFFLKTRRPSFPLILFTFLDAILIISLPFTNFGQEFFHFVSPPISALFIVIFLVFTYFIVSEIVKLSYFRYQASHCNG